MRAISASPAQRPGPSAKEIGNRMDIPIRRSRIAEIGDRTSPGSPPVPAETTCSHSTIDDSGRLPDLQSLEVYPRLAAPPPERVQSRVTTFEQRGPVESILPDDPIAQRASMGWTGPHLLRIVALGSGAALLAYILAGISLIAGLAFAVLLQVAASLTVWSRASPREHERLSRIALVGLLSGVMATAMYDLTKFVLSHLESGVPGFGHCRSTLRSSSDTSAGGRRCPRAQTAPS